MSLSRLVLVITIPVFLGSVEMKPRTVCFCQPVTATISCNVAPPARSSMSRTIACLLNARGTRGVLAAALAFFAGLGAASGGQFQLRFNRAGMFPSQKLELHVRVVISTTGFNGAVMFPSLKCCWSG